MKNNTIDYIKSFKIYDEKTAKEAFIMLDLLSCQKERDSLLENCLKTMIKDYENAVKTNTKISEVDYFIEKYNLNDKETALFIEQVFKKFESRR